MSNSKALYCADNAFVHPQIDVFNYQVRKQAVWQELQEQYVDEITRDGTYARPGTYDEQSECYRDRWDVVRFRRDVENGKTGLPSNFFRVMEEMVSIAPPAKHNAKLFGVELGPSGRPINKTNLLADTIDEAVEKAGEGGIIVSKDVWCQLNQEQKTQTATCDGIHQYAVQSAPMPSIRNPTGYWPEGSGSEGVSVDCGIGVKRTYHCTRKEVTLAFSKMMRATKIVDIGPKTNAEYYVQPGSYELSSKGIKRIGPCRGSGMTTEELRKHMEPYTLRDKVGWHGTTKMVVGSVKYKLDGVFAYLTSENGKASLQLKDGSLWHAKCDLAFKGAFEIFPTGEMYMLYLRSYKGNAVELDEHLQQYFRERLSFSFMMEGKRYDSQMTQTGLPYDGVVFTTPSRHFYYKFAKDKTADIVQGMSNIIGEMMGGNSDCELSVQREEEMEPGIVYRARVDRINKQLVITTRDDGSLKPRIEDSLLGDKILPNKVKNIVDSFDSPTVEDLMDYHKSRALAEDHSECKFCIFMDI